MVLIIHTSNAFSSSGTAPVFTEDVYSFVLSEDASHVDSYVGMVSVQDENTIVSYQITGGKSILPFYCKSSYNYCKTHM